MYSPRVDSTNTIGKQRQRARADGRKRRRVIEGVLGDFAGVEAVTLDFMDGSFKQFEGEGEGPKGGNDLKSTWRPDVVFVDGGNTFWLWAMLAGWEGGGVEGFKEIIERDNTVYIGVSAGAIVAGSRVGTALIKGSDDPTVAAAGRDSRWGQHQGMGSWAVRSFFPHSIEEWEGKVGEWEKEVGGEVGGVVKIGEGDCWLVGEDGNGEYI